MPRTLFISDLHLAAVRPAATAAFFAFLARWVAQAEALYILGDLFEYWIGDDDLGDPFNTSVAQALARTAARGVKVSVMHGNRDFLIGEEGSRFGAPFTGIGLVPDVGMALTLPERVGRPVARAMILAGEVLDAAIASLRQPPLRAGNAAVNASTPRRASARR